MRRRHRSDEGASREPLLPGNPREPRLREITVKATRTTGQVNASYTAFFHLILKKCLPTRAMSEKSSLKYKQQAGAYVNVSW